ncbi:uncharacterized protein LDX57_010337 [Aspergillus melleus]|uniref:uncharacterized protein n=1 Tax=Aspergillus melleus TaxID=138277 RepID=UPI001E8E9BA3|nr:uncharacterized protein LDX57_010337 [Aspergillus melleus]KAH8432710.1 hypothetical protein LDX57_010337 [Aspergillus melleus]
MPLRAKGPSPSSWRRILTGPQALDYRQVVEIPSKIIDKQIHIKIIADEKWAVIQVVKDNLPYENMEYRLDMASVFEAIRKDREPETPETIVSEIVETTTFGERTFWDK